MFHIHFMDWMELKREAVLQLLIVILAASTHPNSTSKNYWTVNRSIFSPIYTLILLKKLFILHTICI